MHHMFKCKPFLFKRPYLDFKPTFKNPGLQKHELQVVPDTGSCMSSPVRTVQAFPLRQPQMFPCINYLLKQFLLKQFLLNTNVFASGLCSKLKEVCHYLIIRRLKPHIFSPYKNLSGKVTDYGWNDRLEIQKAWTLSRGNDFQCPGKKGFI